MIADCHCDINESLFLPFVSKLCRFYVSFLGPELATLLYTYIYIVQTAKMAMWSALTQKMIVVLWLAVQ